MPVAFGCVCIEFRDTLVPPSYPEFHGAGTDFTHVFAGLCSYCHSATEATEQLKRTLVEGTLVAGDAGAFSRRRQDVALINKDRHGLRFEWRLTTCV